MCFKRVYRKTIDFLVSCIVPVAFFMIVGAFVWGIGGEINKSIKEDNRFDQFVSEKKLDRTRVDRFLKYNEHRKIDKSDFMEDPYIMSEYKEYLGKK